MVEESNKGCKTKREAESGQCFILSQIVSDISVTINHWCARDMCVIRTMSTLRPYSGLGIQM